MTDTHYIQAFYHLLALMGVSPDRIKANLTTDETEISEGGFLTIGLPDTSVGFATEKDKPAPFVRDEWTIVPISHRDLLSFGTLFEAVQRFTYEDARKRSAVTTKQTSQHEQWLVDALLQRGVPEADRNYVLYREDGKELTTPDLAWPSRRLAVFVDGLWWHVTMDDRQTMKLLEKDKVAELEKDNRTRAQRDSRIRSQMAADGWTVLTCTDKELEDPIAFKLKVIQIEQVYDRLSRELSITKERHE